jgi:hypothetical protein
MAIAKEDIFQGHAVEVSEELKKSNYGSHFSIMYPDLPTLREMYSHYIKSALSDNKNEIVIILPFLETVDNVRRTLSEDSANINVRKYERDQLLLILDSLKGHFGFPVGLMTFVKQTAEYAKRLGKNGVSVLADMGSFFYYNKKDGLLEYEMDLQYKFENMKLKGFCMYHAQDLDRRLNKNERQILLEHHAKTLKLLTPSDR